MHAESVVVMAFQWHDSKGSLFYVILCKNCIKWLKAKSFTYTIVLQMNSEHFLYLPELNYRKYFVRRLEFVHIMDALVIEYSTSENSLFPAKETKARKVSETKQWITHTHTHREGEIDRKKERQRRRRKASVWRGFMSGACLLAMGLVPLWSTPL